MHALFLVKLTCVCELCCVGKAFNHLVAGLKCSCRFLKAEDGQVVVSIVIVQGFEIKLPLFIPREPHSPKFQAQTKAPKN